MQFNDLSSLSDYLVSRRSGRPREMGRPWPDRATLEDMVAVAARTPDHGKLSPWRFVIVPDERREDFAALLERAFLAVNPDARPVQVEAAVQMARFDAALVAVLYCPHHNHKIPEWEQQLSAGAACMNLLHAGHAHGFVGGWITGWASYDPVVTAAFAGAEGEHIAGFVYFGTPTVPLIERDRPDLDKVCTVWTGE